MASRLLSWGGIPTSSQLSLQLAAASASLRRVHSTRTSNGIQMALRLRVAPAAWRSMRRITRGSTATDAHASRARAPTAPQLLFPYQPSSPRSQAVLAGIGHLRIFSASSTCSDVGRRRPASVECPQSLVGGLATFGAGGAPLGEDEQGLVSDLGAGSLRVKVTLQLWNIA